MTREQVDAMLTKLQRYRDGGDYEGGWMMHDDPSGQYVEFDDVRKMLESIVPINQRSVPVYFRTVCAEVGVIDFESASILWRAAQRASEDAIDMPQTAD